jgi:broad specificity phosphatase PhoE
MSDSIIYLLRHGETLWNTESRLQGHLDSPLTEKGRYQASFNGLRLKSLLAENPTIYSSPLGRCIETARIVASKIGMDETTIERDERLKELNYGQWEGRIKSEIKNSDSELYHARRRDRWNVPAPGGESYSNVAARLQNWLNELNGGSTIVVSHGCTGRILRGIYAGLSSEEISSLGESHESIFVLRGGIVSEFTSDDI